MPPTIMKLSRKEGSPLCGHAWRWVEGKLESCTDMAACCVKGRVKEQKPCLLSELMGPWLRADLP